MATGSELPAGALGTLPPHFHREHLQLSRAEVTTWQALAALGDGELRDLGRQGGASERHLIRLRGQARLVVELGLNPAEAALLLHGGIADRVGLASADPHQLHRALGRLQRNLTGRAVPPLDLATVHRWIQRARRGPSRSSN